MNNSYKTLLGWGILIIIILMAQCSPNEQADETLLEEPAETQELTIEQYEEDKAELKQLKKEIIDEEDIIIQIANNCFDEGKFLSKKDIEALTYECTDMETQEVSKYSIDISKVENYD